MWVWPDWHKYENYNFDATHLKASWAMSTGSVLMEFTVHPCIYPYYAPLAHYSSPAHQISVLRSVVSDGGQMPIFSLKMSLFLWNSVKKVKKMIQRQKK